MFVITSVLVSSVIFVNSFPRYQHTLDIAVTPIDIDLNILSYHASLLLFQFHSKCSPLICFMVMIISCEFPQNPYSILVEAKDTTEPTRNKSGKDRSWDEHGKNITLLLQHRQSKLTWAQCAQFH